MTLLAVLSPSFTAPSFRMFCGLACGFLAQPGKRTVCGMLAGAGLSRLWPHDRAHSFFSRARWKPDDLGLAVARLVVSLLVPDGEPVEAAVDDTLFRRRGKKVWAASWFHDGSAPGRRRRDTGTTGWSSPSSCDCPCCRRPVAVPVMAKLVIKGSNSRSRLWLARRMAEALAGALPGRAVHVVAGSAYAGGGAEEPARRGDLDYQAAQGRRAARAAAGRAPGRRAGPGVRGDRLPPLAKLAATAAFAQVTVTRYGKDGHHPRRRHHLPVVLRLRPPPRHRRAHPGQVRLRLRPRPAHHRPGRDRRAGHRALRRQMGHRSRDRRREAAPRMRPGPQPRRRRPSSAPSRSSSPARPSPSSGTPPRATTPPTSRTAARAHPGTHPRPSRPPQT